MMLGAIMLALAAAGPQAPDPAVCTVGREILADIPRTQSPSGEWDLYVSPGHDAAPSLFEHCPGLLKALPERLNVADDAAMKRAVSDGPYHSGRTAAIYSIGVPVLARDRRTATVTITYACSGLCGGE